MVLHTIISEYDVLFADTDKGFHAENESENSNSNQCFFSTDPYAYLNSDNRKADFK